MFYLLLLYFHICHFDCELFNIHCVVLTELEMDFNIMRCLYVYPFGANFSSEQTEVTGRSAGKLYL